MKIVAVTSCATGIAHTYLAAELLAKTARSMGHSIKIETQGVVGIENELSLLDIAMAEVAILAIDGRMKKAERFVSLPRIEVPVLFVLEKPEEVFSRIAQLHLKYSKTLAAASTTPARVLDAVQHPD
jgi:fructose-specific phosphotransferase system IIB component